MKTLSEFLDFSMAESRKKGKSELIYINGVPVVPGDKSIDISDMGEIISRNKMDAKQLRKQAWRRNK
jgi:hypothetical protein